jgi:peptidoglycan/LPS O-acetylase OafA/YrhL
MPDYPTGKYRPDIDGLRAIAVSSVVAFHAFPAIFTGGFLGVDIFFVISGYLITSLIIDAALEDRFSYLDFYARRIRRIFPALTTVIVASLVAGWYLLLPDEFARFGKHLAAGAGFATNFILWSEAGYFDTASELKPLLHLWSLAVEEQFYIIWPLLLSFFLTLRRGPMLGILLIAGISFVYSVYEVNKDPVIAFYSPLSRFWELMLGGALAYLVIQKNNWLSYFRGVRAALGLVLIVGSVLMISAELGVPGFWALVPTLGAVLVISAGHASWVSKYVLGNRIMVGIGLISYPLYLWHWPILVFAKIVKGSYLTRTDRLLLISLSVMLAFLTYQYIERPIRRSPHVLVPRGLAVGMVFIAMIGVAAVTGVFDSRLRDERLTPILDAKQDWAYPPVAAESHWLGNIRYFVESSKLDNYTLFVGDSNLEQYAPRVDRAIKENPTGMNGAIFVGNQSQCTLVKEMLTGGDRCPHAISELETLIRRQSTQAVVIAMNWLPYKDELADGANQKRFVQFLRPIAERKSLYIILNIPSGDELAPANMFTGSRLQEIALKPLASIRFDFERFQEKYAGINLILGAIAAKSGAQLIDPIPFLCPDQRCPVFDSDGKPLYKDGAHLTRSYAMKAATYIDATLNSRTGHSEGSPY